MNESNKQQITVCAGVATEAIGANGRRTYAILTGGIKVMGYDRGDRYYQFNWDGTTWQIRDDKVRLGWAPLPWPWWKK